MTTVERRAIDVSQAHAGLASDRSLVAAGISDRTIRRRVERGDWRRPAPGVVEVRRSHDRWRAQLWLGLLAAGPDAVVSHRSAAALHGLGGIQRPTPADITVPRVGRWRGERYRVHTTRHPITTPPTVDGFPVTPVARTLRDLAVVVPSDVLSRALHDALRSGVPVARLRVEAASSRPGARRLRDALSSALDLASADVESPLEAAWVAVLADRFPDGLRTQHVLRLADGRRVRLDVAWPDALVAVEVDGARWHADAVARARDVERRRALTDEGWTVVHVTVSDLDGRRLELALAAIAAALTTR